MDEAAKAMADPAIQIQFVNEFLNLSKINSKGLRTAMTKFLLDMNKCHFFDVETTNRIGLK